MPKKKAYPFPPGGLPPYLQAFLVTLESGAVVLARVMAEDRLGGQSLARAAALSAFPGGAIWADSPYPCGQAERAAGPGFDVLKEAPADLARAIGPEYPAGYWGAV